MQKAVCCDLEFPIRTDWEKLEGSHLDSHIGDICPRRRVFREIALVDRFRFITHQMSQPHREQTSRDEADPEARPPEGALIPQLVPKARRPRAAAKEKRARDPLSPCDPGQGRNTLQPIAAVGGVFDDGVRLHEVRIDGADEARTVRGEALELLRRIEAVERIPVLEVELHHGVDRKLVVSCGLAVHIAGHDEVLGITGMAGARLDELGVGVAPFALELGSRDVLGAAYT